MAIQTVNLAVCKCSMGTVPTPLKVLPVKRVLASNQPAASIMDHVPGLNVGPFVMCMSKTNPAVIAATVASQGKVQVAPCVPATPAPWIVGAPTVLIGNMPALDNSSKLVCALGGMIQIVFPGQVTVMIP